MPNTLAIGVAYSDQAISGGSVDATPIGAVTPSTVVGSSVYSNGELGYTAAAQGTVTQATSKSTAVTLNRSAGRITLNAASLAAQTNVSFTLNNSFISANDTLIVTVSGGATIESYNCWVNSLGAGTASITLRNITAATALAEAVVINFALIHCV
ncbi:hypothetical protein UFOVP1355_43 [uncultured Caudovirales phage]|uniref:Uncharacterized protein n=1 Tax=uncultured Caudovirales phage TaxID=2100421 RepID=A0A6J5RWS0_9CAUD|nr:hypothetical protein UFOVP1355_43 [uncultured Caudovirales phage]